ncbi:MAG TPA: NAD(P)H-dependent oxidoreductase [Gammaproteobacteria bacterium]
MAKRLLLVAHAPSANTVALRDALLAGARHPEIGGVAVDLLTPFAAGPDEVLAADAVLLATPENFGYMSGALKDFFDRVYYPCLERSAGLPYALCVRAGNDGSGAVRSVERIVGGLGWRRVQPPLVCSGPMQPGFLAQGEQLGMTLAAGLEAGLY